MVLITGYQVKKINIIYEDKYLIVVYKPKGMLTIRGNNHNDNNLYDEVKTYLKRKNPKNKVFIVHRLDKDTSGLIVFSKSEKVKYELQNNWHDVIRRYYAVVCGKFIENTTLKDYLYESKSLDVFITKDKEKGKLAITNVEVLAYNNKYSILDINILTGRKNQIRVQLASRGYPILGDKKYGIKKYPRMMLDAYYLKFKHPVLNTICEFKMPMDSLMENFIKKSCN